MKVLFLTLGNELVASSRTRVFQYLPHLAPLGVEAAVIQYQTGADYWWSARVSPKGPVSSLLFKTGIATVRLWHFVSQKAALRRMVADAKNHDLVFIQKVVPPTEVLDALGDTLFVFDFDDAIYANDSYDADRIREVVGRAALAIVENDETEAFVRSCGTDALKITGPIDCDRYRPTERGERDEVIIGWVGSGSTTPYLSMVAEPLRRLCSERPNVRVALIGAGHIDMPGVPVIRHPWTLETESDLLARFDIGLMPLPDDPWTRGKGGYKILQYMAVGAATVCSPVGVNADMVIDGATGFHADDEEVWYERLKRLVDDVELRHRMGKEARHRAETTYSFAINAPLLFDALREVIHGR